LWCFFFPQELELPLCAGQSFGWKFMTVPWETIPRVLWGNVGSGCWRMETHENIARGDVMLLFFGG